jgi:hypothetical protein
MKDAHAVAYPVGVFPRGSDCISCTRNRYLCLYTNPMQLSSKNEQC